MWPAGRMLPPTSLVQLLWISSNLTFLIFLNIFFWCMLHLATCIFSFFYNKPELDARIDPGMTLAPFSSSILDETRFEPTTFE